jgi:hypothetical protein
MGKGSLQDARSDPPGWSHGVRLSTMALRKKIRRRFSGVKILACPFFMPVRRLNGPWLHPQRLPLGGGWQGHCTAPGHEGAVPEPEHLHAGCNLGYAADCPWLPPDRVWDAVRFSVASDGQERIVLCYVCEMAHRPGEHGQLEYGLLPKQWLRVHPDPRLQAMAECFLEAHLGRTRRGDARSAIREAVD